MMARAAIPNASLASFQGNLLVFCCCHRLGFYVHPSENCWDFSQVLSGWAINVFKSLQLISPHERMEVIDSVIFGQLIMKFETRLK